MDYNLSTIHSPLSTIFFAYIFDLIFGDPQISWHPARIIGRLIEKFERILNVDNINKMFGGSVLVVLVVGITVFCVWVISRLAALIHPIIYYISLALLIYFALSVKSLAIEANKVYIALKKKDIDGARKCLSMIVARDTSQLDEPQIIRATVETVAESIMDGIIAPLFYAFLGGPILAWCYKAINTLDSMVGYRSERFIDFGNASAKADGLMNLIPARLTCFFISLSGLCSGKDWIRSSKWGIKYFFKGSEFNSEATEAAMAGALKIQLGGLNFYNSAPIRKTLIGDNIQYLDIRHIKESINIAYLASFLFMVTGMSLAWRVRG